MADGKRTESRDGCYSLVGCFEELYLILRYKGVYAGRSCLNSWTAKKFYDRNRREKSGRHRSAPCQVKRPDVVVTECFPKRCAASELVCVEASGACSPPEEETGSTGHEGRSLLPRENDPERTMAYGSGAFHSVLKETNSEAGRVGRAVETVRLPSGCGASPATTTSRARSLRDDQRHSVFYRQERDRYERRQILERYRRQALMLKSKDPRHVGCTRSAPEGVKFSERSKTGVPPVRNSLKRVGNQAEKRNKLIVQGTSFTKDAVEQAYRKVCENFRISSISGGCGQFRDVAWGGFLHSDSIFKCQQWLDDMEKTENNTNARSFAGRPCKR